MRLVVAMEPIRILPVYHNAVYLSTSSEYLGMPPMLNTETDVFSPVTTVGYKK